MHCCRRLIVQTLVFSRSYLHRQVSSPETLLVKGGTTWARNGLWNLPENARLPRNFQGSFTCRKSTTWDKWLDFPSEGRRAEDFFFSLRKIRPGQHATSRPPKPLTLMLIYCAFVGLNNKRNTPVFKYHLSHSLTLLEEKVDKNNYDKLQNAQVYSVFCGTSGIPSRNLRFLRNLFWNTLYSRASCSEIGH